jgi:hypothetical protein
VSTSDGAAAGAGGAGAIAGEGRAAGSLWFGEPDRIFFPETGLIGFDSRSVPANAGCGLRSGGDRPAPHVND